MIFCLILSVIPALVIGCCAPDKWKSTDIIIYSVKQPDGVSYQVEIVGSHHADATRQMSVYNQTVHTADGTSFVQTIYQFFNQSSQYTVRNGKCNKENLTRPDINCLPKEATVVTHSFIGAGSTKIKTTMYALNTMTSKSYFTVADDGCIPILSESSETRPDGTKVRMTVESFGVNIDISDPSIFNLPSSCMMQ